MATFKFTFIDLFGGIGGFHLALKYLGGKCIMYSDIDANSANVYKQNFNMVNSGDIRKLDIYQIPDFDVLCAGFPCQSFSNAGHKKAFDDERGTLFNNIIDIIRIKQPTLCILENVKHIKRVSNGDVYKYIYTKLQIENYETYDTIHNVLDFGIPQNRERCVFIAINKNAFSNKYIQILSYFKHLLPKLKEKLSTKFTNMYLRKLSFIDPPYLTKYKITLRTEMILNAWNDLIKQLNVNTNISFPLIIDYWFTDFTEFEIRSFKAWKQNYIKRNKEFYTSHKMILDNWYSRNKKMLDERDIYRKLEWQVGKIKIADSIFNYYIQFRQSGIRVKKSEYFPTLVAINQTSIIGKEKRYISPKECAFIQSFPSSFIIDLVDKHAYKQFGNAVNVDMIYTNMLCLFLSLRKFNFLQFEDEKT